MLTAALAVLAALLAVGAATAGLLWRATRIEVADLEDMLAATLRELDGYQRADDDTLRLPPAADPALLPAEIEAWLAGRGDQ